MSVLVKVVNGDTEWFKNATDFRTDARWRRDDEGSWLSVFQGDVELGFFPPGSWIGARFSDDHVLPPSEPGDAVQAVEKAQRAIDSLRGKTVTINLHTPDDPDDGIKVAA